METHALMWSLPLWLFNFVILLVVLYVVSLIKRITVAIERIAANRN